MIAIKLNPSQTLRLRNEFANDKGFERAGVFATPLLCPIENFSREDFLSIKKFSIYKMQNAGGIYFFPCSIELPQGIKCAAFLCGISVQQPQGVEGAHCERGNFSLEDFFAKAMDIVYAAPENFWSGENFFFNATSFKMCTMEISGNSWKFYDEVWKKISA